MPIVLRQTSEDSTGNTDSLAGRTVSLLNAKLSHQNFINDALDLIEEDTGNLSLANDDAGDSSDEETRQIRVATPQPTAQKFVESYEIQNPLWDMETVTDWGVRIAGYDEKQKEFYNNMVPKLNELKGIAKSEQGWDLIVDAKNDRIKIECKRSIRGILMMRA
jgi:hypothetical protein